MAFQPHRRSMSNVNSRALLIPNMCHNMMNNAFNIAC